MLLLGFLCSLSMLFDNLATKAWYQELEKLWAVYTANH